MALTDFWLKPLKPSRPLEVLQVAADRPFGREPVVLLGVDQAELQGSVEPLGVDRPTVPRR